MSTEPKVYLRFACLSPGCERRFYSAIGRGLHHRVAHGIVGNTMSTCARGTLTARTFTRGRNFNSETLMDLIHLSKPKEKPTNYIGT